MGNGRRAWSHVIEVSRHATTHETGGHKASEVLFRRICVRYEDSRRMYFIPESGEEFFSRDDAHGVVGMLHKGSEVLEWGLRRHRRGIPARGRTTPAPSDLWGCLILAPIGLPGYRGKEP
jgi:hypothetical protein